ncbi:unnamed protein product [Schistosoma margrebowiei]|uniref:Egg protein CP391S-like protein n=1 Tax=Schistosoma margrebowiei TaxID=48269 RepID=A0AA85APG3_9TREM|nr:unnamed protein product [Schistosoma margrebowiei]
MSNYLGRDLSRHLLNEKGLFAARWSLEGEDKENTPIVTNLLYPNGKISIFYENNIFEISNTTVYGIRGFFQCKTGKTEHEISVPSKWIKTGTLVEYEVIGTICPIHNSFEACRKATTSNVKCIWCEKWNTCIDSHHQDNHFFKVNDCHFKSPDVNDVSTSTPVNQNGTTFGIPEVQVGGNVKETTNGNEQYSSPDVNDVSTSTPVNQNGTTFGIPEVQVGGNVKETTNGNEQYSNATTEITQESEQNKSLWYLYIVIPSVVFFFAACISCVICRW